MQCLRPLVSHCRCTVPLQGLLFRYGPAPANVAFMTAQHKRHVVIIGGLTDGLLACKWVPPLAQRLDHAGWSVVQPLLSSSYAGWGLGSLNTDAQELHALAQHLKSEHKSEVRQREVSWAGGHSGPPV